MKVHEYQARELLGQAGVPVPPGTVARSGAEAGEAFTQMGVPLAVDFEWGPSWAETHKTGAAVVVVTGVTEETGRVQPYGQEKDRDW